MRPGAVIEVGDVVHAVLATYDEDAGGSPGQHRDREHAAVRQLLAWLLARLGARPARVETHSSGRPFLPDRPELGVSLSHSGPWLAAAVGTGCDVGVDVQRPEPVPAGLLRRCCDPPARAALTALPDADRDLEFAWIWSVQEACVKATGDGLAGRPWTVPVALGQDRGEWEGVRWRALRERGRPPLSCAYRPRRPAAVAS
ncbi:4'-phosphopantetheinyl transferase superfamily protein [Dactylosporangium roseum]|uniref:4'-phosphopantetheinyl transferase superfamily protein n=1 Tax=Dactylosporangium roseum TaxID=47989 RepID=A0ABY5ZC20_9ACTN|nr:4'-phosphopantetheinyl transferase superfamily protein [Dactylosporangium roseum]UWZ39581.1 4'-phosphopantetheinyl transferase superfamily protein [Dactylosporangium roseum]